MALIFQAESKPLLIAHAGGGINGQNYSNSLEALDNSYAKGFQFFEIDFSWTSDGELVCLHDWEKRFKKVFGFKTKEPLTYQAFQQLVEKTSGLHPCTLETFAQWVLKHEDVKIITDVKHENIKAIKKIIKQYPQLQKQLIVQFYQPEEYQILRHLGFDQLIWILYQYKGSYQSIVEHSQNMQLFAISMRASQVKKKSMQKLINQGKRIFVYTINKDKKVHKLISKFGVSGIYTDFLLPNSKYTLKNKS